MLRHCRSTLLLSRWTPFYRMPPHSSPFRLLHADMVPNKISSQVENQLCTALIPHLLRISSSSSLSSSSEGEKEEGKSPQEPTSDGNQQELSTQDVEGEQGHDDLGFEEPIPRMVVEELDKFIIGQSDAKKAVAIALRNRWRRRKVSPDLAEEINPKNILMVGPTGVGKTEIARRLAKLCDAPFIKAEATKFTEVGFHGKDVESLIKDLVEIALVQAKDRFKKIKKAEIEAAVEKKLLDLCVGKHTDENTKDKFRDLLRKGELDPRIVDVHIPDKAPASPQGGDVINLVKIFGAQDGRFKRKKMSVAEARPILFEQEAEKIFSSTDHTQTALKNVEENGIVFIDEIDKICVTKEGIYSGSDASNEGVQRDLLPLIEGSSVTTNHGTVDTSKILFIACGAFHSCKPSDLLAELQGRLPVRVELKALDKNDLYKIMTDTKYNQITQQVALLKAENIDLRFTDESIWEIAQVAMDINASVRNIGARRLHTIIEKVLGEISFNCDKYAGQTVEISKEDVRKNLEEMLKVQDLSRFVL